MKLHIILAIAIITLTREALSSGVPPPKGPPPKGPPPKGPPPKGPPPKGPPPKGPPPKGPPPKGPPPKGPPPKGDAVFPFSGCLSTSGWMEFNGHCYKLVHDINGQDSNKDTILNACRIAGPTRGTYSFAYLADIESQTENDFVAEVVAAGNRAWIGGERQDSAFAWVTEGGSVEQMTYINWKPNEPSDTDGREDCIEINRGPPGKWNDLYCQRKRPGVCKYNIDLLTSKV